MNGEINVRELIAEWVELESAEYQGRDDVTQEEILEGLACLFESLLEHELDRQRKHYLTPSLS